MPYKIIKRKCKQSNGKKGQYIVVKKSDNKKQSCHTSKKKAQSAVRARYANESEVRAYIRSLLESKQTSKFDAILQKAIADLKKLDAEESEPKNKHSRSEDAVKELQRLLGGR